MKIIGIDPGFDRCGYGIVSRHDQAYSLEEMGCVQTNKKQPYSERILQVFDELQKVIKKHKPHKAVIEDLFFSKNVTTAIKVGQARGIVLLLLAKQNIPIIELTPPQVKQAVTGYGRAQKEQVTHMVKRILKLKETPSPDDISDALACAVAGFSFSNIG